MTKPNTIRVFYVEGETELRLLNCLNLRGQLKKFNFWNNKVNKILRTIKANYCVCIVYDIDDINEVSLKRFIASVKLISQSCFKVILLQQTKNLEDELIYSCQCKEKSLLEAFKACSRSELKGNFNKTKTPLPLLSKLNFEKSKLWNRSIIPNLTILNKQKNIYFTSKHLND